MRGSIRKQGTRSWEVRLYVPNPVTGKAERKSFTVRGTKKEAQQFQAARIAEILSGQFLDVSAQPVTAYAHIWLETITPTIRANTHNSYTWVVDTYILPVIGPIPLGKVTPQHLNKMYADMLARGGSRNQGLSTRTVRYTHTIIHRMFKDAVRWGHLIVNPADQADPPKQSKTKRKNDWSSAEVGTFLKATRGDEKFAFWHLAVFTGMRRSELCGLIWDNVDLDRSRLAVEQTLVKVGSTNIVSQPKTEAGRRIVMLDPVTVEVLREHKAQQDILRENDTYNDDDFVFTWDDGRPVKPDWVSREFKRLQNGLGLTPITLHGLRHTHASLAFRAKVSPKVVQERLGHSNISITMDLYTHTEDDIHSEAADAVAGLLGG